MTKEELQELKLKILRENKLQNIKDYFPKMTAYEYLYDCNKDRLDCFALNYLGRKITFKEFFEKIDNTAKAYAEIGIKSNDVVSMCMLTTPESLISFYALNKIGALVHMINIANNKDDIVKHLKNTDSKTFITLDIFYSNQMKNAMDKAGVIKVVVSSLSNSLPNVLTGDKLKFAIIELVKKKGNAVKLDDRCISWDELQKIGENSNLILNSNYIPNQSVAIAYTSGSTGEAKAVVATNEAMNSMPVQMGMTDQTFAPNDSIFNTLPTWIYYSLVNNIHDPLCMGVSVDIDPLFDSKKIDKRLKQFKFNHWNTIPAYVEDMVNNKKVRRLDLSHLKSITTGGDYLTQQLQGKANFLVRSCNSNINVGQGYGASEILGSFGYTYERNATKGSVGKALVGNSFKIINIDDGKILGVNEIGELYLFSPTLMKEYYKNPTATSEVLIEDENGIVWYKTGDLAHFNENNEIFIDGRIRRIVMAKDDKGLPTKIFPDKIKKIILLNEYVDKCEIITVNDDKYINKPIAFIVLRNGIELTPTVEKSIQNLCKANLENYTLPSKYNFVDNIPLKPSLKPDLDALEKQYYEEINGKQKVKAIQK